MGGRVSTAPLAAVPDPDDFEAIAKNLEAKRNAYAQRPKFQERDVVTYEVASDLPFEEFCRPLSDGQRVTVVRRVRNPEYSHHDDALTPIHYVGAIIGGELRWIEVSRGATTRSRR